MDRFGDFALAVACVCFGLWGILQILEFFVP
jgi:hypothetical protein